MEGMVLAIMVVVISAVIPPRLIMTAMMVASEMHSYHFKYSHYEYLWLWFYDIYDDIDAYHIFDVRSSSDNTIIIIISLYHNARNLVGRGS